MTVAIETRLAVRPLELARRIWSGVTPMLLWTRSGSGPSYLACDPVATRVGLDPEPELEPSTLGRWAHVPKWFGVLPYEAQRARLERAKYVLEERRPPPMFEENVWWRYPAVAVIDSRVTLVGDDYAAVEALRERLTAAPEQRTRPRLSPRDLGGSDVEHRARIERALEYIRDGEIYQVNLARRLEFDVHGAALDLLEHMSEAARAPYCAAFVDPHGREVISTSPELFLRHEPGGRVLTVPIKGTRPRGNDASSERRLAAALDADEKERAELAMVVDIERNDLGRVATIGSVVAESPRVVRHTGVFHRQARVSARLPPQVDRSELLRATLPSGSITGAPKVRTMEIIRELEVQRRGLYTGAFGFVSRAGGLHLAMAIRTLCRQDALGYYWVGGGIVADSDPQREVEETRWKAVQLQRLIDVADTA